MERKWKRINRMIRRGRRRSLKKLKLLTGMWAIMIEKSRKDRRAL